MAARRSDAADGPPAPPQEPPQLGAAGGVAAGVALEAGAVADHRPLAAGAAGIAFVSAQPRAADLLDLLMPLRRGDRHDGAAGQGLRLRQRAQRRERLRAVELG